MSFRNTLQTISVYFHEPHSLVLCLLIPTITFALGTLVAKWVFDHWDETHNAKVQTKLEKRMKRIVRKRQKFTKYMYEESSDDYSSEEEESPSNVHLSVELPNVAEPKSLEDYTCRMCAMTLDQGDQARVIKVSRRRSFAMNCGHRYCYECWGDYLEQFDAIGKRGMVECLSEGCARALKPAHVYAVLAKNEVETEAIPSPKLARPRKKKEKAIMPDGKDKPG
jgi:hypothetical protein